MAHTRKEQMEAKVVTPKEKRWFTHQEASDLTGLTVQTLKTYAFRTDMVRGDDFYVHRYARFRRRMYWTQRGIARLKTRSYRVWREHRPNEANVVDLFPLPARYDGKSRDESVARLASAIRLAFSKYLKTPCAVPNCPCMTHRLGLPQADVIAQALIDRKAPR